MTVHLLQTSIHYLDTWERVSHRSQLNVITVGGKFNSLSRDQQRLIMINLREDEHEH